MTDPQRVGTLTDAALRAAQLHSIETAATLVLASLGARFETEECVAVLRKALAMIEATEPAVTTRDTEPPTPFAVLCLCVPSRPSLNGRCLACALPTEVPASTCI